MPTASKCKSDSKRFAVIRNYDPTRIERELLAQVFEVVCGRKKPCSRGLFKEDRTKANTVSGQTLESPLNVRDFPSDAIENIQQERAA